MMLLSSSGWNASTGRHTDSIELVVKTTIKPLWVPHASEQTKGVILLAGVIDPNYQEKGGLFSWMEHRKRTKGSQDHHHL